MAALSRLAPLTPGFYQSGRARSADEAPQGQTAAAPSPSGREAVQGAELVAVGVAQVGEGELAEAALADARRVLDGRAAVGDAGGVPGVGLCRRLAGEAQSEAVRVVGGL